MYLVYQTLRIVLGLLVGGLTAVLLIVFGVPPVIPALAGWTLTIVFIYVYFISEGARGRHRLYVFSATALGMGLASNMLLVR
jgi:ABC-type nickel/cobalt efflux system permease component RcnA